MLKKTIQASAALSTTVSAEKVERIADECGVQITLVDTRMRSDRKWINDFEVEGPTGKVDAFIARVRDVEIH